MAKKRKRASELEKTKININDFTVTNKYKARKVSKHGAKGLSNKIYVGNLWLSFGRGLSYGHVDRKISKFKIEAKSIDDLKTKIIKLYNLPEYPIKLGEIETQILESLYKTSFSIRDYETSASHLQWQMSYANSIYPSLNSLIKKGFIKKRNREEGVVYSLTEKGKTILKKVFKDKEPL